jgi:hypothetical protein
MSLEKSGEFATARQGIRQSLSGSDFSARFAVGGVFSFLGVVNHRSKVNQYKEKGEVNLSKMQIPLLRMQDPLRAGRHDQNANRLAI